MSHPGDQHFLLFFLSLDSPLSKALAKPQPPNEMAVMAERIAYLEAKVAQYEKREAAHRWTGTSPVPDNFPEALVKVERPRVHVPAPEDFGNPARVKVNPNHLRDEVRFSARQVTSRPGPPDPETLVLQEEADTDMLTGLPNLRSFVAYRDQLVDTLMRQPTKEADVSVVFIDLIDFKSVNTNHGHPVGSVIIRAHLKALHDGLQDVGWDRPEDGGFRAFRVGGDEICLMGQGKVTKEALNALWEATQVRFDSYIEAAYGRIAPEDFVSKNEPGKVISDRAWAFRFGIAVDTYSAGRGSNNRLRELLTDHIGEADFQNELNKTGPDPRTASNGGGRRHYRAKGHAEVLLRGDREAVVRPEPQSIDKAREERSRLISVLSEPGLGAEQVGLSLER